MPKIWIRVAPDGGVEFCRKVEGPWKELATPPREFIERLSAFRSYDDDDESPLALSTAVGIEEATVLRLGLRTA